MGMSILFFMSLKTIINCFENELEEKVKAKESAISAYRRAITCSKQAVMAVHRAELENAKNKLSEAQSTLEQTEAISISHRDLLLSIERVAYQEYAEAAILLKLVETKTFPDPRELNIPTLAYLLGLADAIGEFRRRALEALRQRKLKIAQNCLSIMDEIYSALMVLDNAYVLIPELRHKCDVARRLIEITLGDVTTETRRNSLEKSIVQLEAMIKQNKQ